MNQALLVRLAWSGLFACAIAGSAVALWYRPPAPAPTTADLLAVHSTSMQVKLKPATAGNPFGAVESDYFQLTGRPESHLDLPDGRSVAKYDRADGSLEYKLEFYPRLADQPGGKLEHATKYGVDGVTPVVEIGFHSNGYRAMAGLRLDNGDYRTRTYFDDGLKLASEKVVGQIPDSYDRTPTLLKETRWNQNHQISLLNVLNKDDSRDVTTYDENGLVTEVSHLTSSVLGSTVAGYYPGTKTLRVRSTSTYYETDVEMFRKNGTLRMKLAISSSSVAITYIDLDGKRATLGQTWFFTRTPEDGIVTMKDFKIYTVTQMDADGQPYQQWDINTATGKQVWSIDLYNRVVDGVHWKEVYNFYDEQGLLNRISYIPDDNSGLERKMVDYKPEQGIRGSMPPSDLMFPPTIEGNFAIPYPQTGH